MGTVRPATAPREKPISDDTDPRALRFLARETRTRATATTVRAEASNSPATIPLRSQSARVAPPRPPKRRIPEALLARAREEDRRARSRANRPRRERRPTRASAPRRRVRGEHDERSPGPHPVSPRANRARTPSTRRRTTRGGEGASSRAFRRRRSRARARRGVSTRMGRTRTRPRE